MESQDTEITLGTAKLLVLFFGLVVICAVFFAFGYTLGRKSDAGLLASSAMQPQAASNTKPASTPQQPMTFYKAVEQKEANPQLTPAADSNPPAGDQAAASASESAKNANPQSTPSAPDPAITLPGPGYFVQVAAVSKEEDANALVEALKKKQYPAFVAANSATDKLFRVQLGPFGDVKEAEAMRARLVGDGYNPILKK
ncbi:MAG TPA: SPOR domain-containing protein [Candidatus Binatia bacterium]|nr:SPOR domain-containing protein [Candidatus Binatia bacterium]